MTRRDFREQLHAIAKQIVPGELDEKQMSFEMIWPVTVKVVKLIQDAHNDQLLRAVENKT